MTSIQVTFGSIEQAHADTATVAGHLEATLEQLKTYLAPMKETWQGAASTEYQSLQARWDTSAADLNLVLRQIAASLDTALLNYTGTEQHEANRWTVA